jgi:hypothetical protein
MNLIKKAISIYEKYLTDVITPKIPVGATVIFMVILMLLVKKITIKIYL